MCFITCESGQASQRNKKNRLVTTAASPIEIRTTACLATGKTDLAGFCRKGQSRPWLQSWLQHFFSASMAEIEVLLLMGMTAWFLIFGDFKRRGNRLILFHNATYSRT